MLYEGRRGGGSQEEVVELRFILGKTSEVMMLFSPQTVRTFFMADTRRECYSNCVLLYIDF